MPDNAFYISLRSTDCMRTCTDLRDDIGDVAFRRTDIDERRANRQNVVDLARMQDSDKLIPHDHDVTIGRGERRGQSVQRLIRQVADIRQSAFAGKGRGFSKLTSSADEAKGNLGMILQTTGRFQERAEGTSGAV